MHQCQRFYRRDQLELIGTLVSLETTDISMLYFSELEEDREFIRISCNKISLALRSFETLWPVFGKYSCLRLSEI